VNDNEAYYKWERFFMEKTGRIPERGEIWNHQQKKIDREMNISKGYSILLKAKDAEVKTPISQLEKLTKCTAECKPEWESYNMCCGCKNKQALEKIEQLEEGE